MCLFKALAPSARPGRRVDEFKSWLKVMVEQLQAIGAHDNELHACSVAFGCDGFDLIG